MAETLNSRYPEKLSTEAVRPGPHGFTLLELLIAALLVVVAVVASLHSLQIGFTAYRETRVRRDATIDLWNRSRRVRLEPTGPAEPLEVLPGARPLYRVVLEPPKSSRTNLRWEVLRAEK